MTEDEIVEAMGMAFLFKDMRAALRIASPWVREQAQAKIDEWERKYHKICIGADPNASADAKEFRAATERACDDAIVRYKHEARTAREQAIAPFIAALTPSADTKRAYVGEFSFAVVSIGSDGDEITTRLDVPWTTIKEIMKAICDRALIPVRPSQTERV
jgi:hypothetical protein